MDKKKVKLSEAHQGRRPAPKIAKGNLIWQRLKYTCHYTLHFHSLGSFNWRYLDITRTRPWEQTVLKRPNLPLNECLHLSRKSAIWYGLCPSLSQFELWWLLPHKWSILRIPLHPRGTSKLQENVGRRIRSIFISRLFLKRHLCEDDLNISRPTPDVIKLSAWFSAWA